MVEEQSINLAEVVAHQQHLMKFVGSVLRVWPAARVATVEGSRTSWVEVVEVVAEVALQEDTESSVYD